MQVEDFALLSEPKLFHPQVKAVDLCIYLKIACYAPEKGVFTKE